jgi:predicted TIM-barrel fold metal-dependent hydrolase
MDEVKSLGWIDPPERVIRFMDMVGIDKAVVSTYCNTPGIKDDALEYVAENVAKYPDRLIPYVRLDPWYGQRTLEVLTKAVEIYKFKGAKLHPVHYSLHPFGEDTVNIMKRAAHYVIPVLFHCSDEMMCLPYQIEEACRQSPDTKVILAHMGGFFHRADAIEVAYNNENVYLDTCEFPYPEGIREAARKLGSRKLLFGTDLPTDNPFFEIEKIKCIHLPKEDEDNIFFKNIASILKINLQE